MIINDSEFYLEVSDNFKPRPKYVRLVPVKNYLNKIDILNSTKLKENGVEGFAYQSELVDETTAYINSI